MKLFDDLFDARRQLPRYPTSQNGQDILVLGLLRGRVGKLEQAVFASNWLIENPSSTAATANP